MALVVVRVVRAESVDSLHMAGELLGTDLEELNLALVVLDLQVDLGTGVHVAGRGGRRVHCRSSAGADGRRNGRCQTGQGGGGHQRSLEVHGESCGCLGYGG